MLYQKSWARAWLGLGLVWFLAAIALAPSNKVYQQGWCCSCGCRRWSWPGRRGRAGASLEAPAGAVGERAAAVGLERLSLAWSSAEDDGREIKRLLYILVFLLAFPLLAQLGLGRIRQLLLLGSALLAIAALVSIIKFYGLQRAPC
jgi:hypothetical protein